jgi:hypothetical protein
MSISNGLTIPNNIANGATTDAPTAMANWNALLVALNRALLDAGSGAGMNAFGSQIHNLGAGSVSTDAVNLGQLAAYLPLTGGTLTGALVAEDGLFAATQPTGDSTLNAATTAFVQAQLAASLTTYATLVSPALTGVPTAPTAAAGTNTTQIATTAFADAAAAAAAGAAAGLSQVWTNVLTTPGRALGTTYTNATGAPIEVSLSFAYSSANSTANFVVGGVLLGQAYLSINSNTVQGPYTFRVPVGATYSVSVTGSATLGVWAELR